MKVAENIKELSNSLIPNYPLKQGRDDQFYQPIYTDEIDELRDDILYENIPAQTLFISGQTGSGKTTALHFLPNEEIENAYEVVFLNAKELFELSDVSIIEILIMICHVLIDKDESGALKQEFFKEIEQLDKVEKGVLQQDTITEKKIGGSLDANIKARLGGNPIARLLNLFKLEGNFFAGLRGDASYREITREAFVLNKMQLLGICNRIVDRFLIQQVDGKQLLIIINELDHLKNPKIIRDIFITNRRFLKRIRCKKVISVPVSLITEEEFMEEVKYFCIKLSKNPNPNRKDIKYEHIINKNQQTLYDLVQKRFTNALIEDEAIACAIQYSGGILRQYISILHAAAKKARRYKGERVNRSNVEDGMHPFRQMLERSMVMSNDKIIILDEIRKHHKTDYAGAPDFIECLLGNQILAFMNDPTWYSVNPLIEKTVETYADSSNTSTS